VFLAAAALLGLVAVAAPPLVEAGPPVHCNQVNLHPNNLPNGQENVVYGPGNVLWLTPNSLALPAGYNVLNVAGSLPNGLGFVLGPNNNQVTLAGTPQLGSQGTYTFTVTVGGTYVLGTICLVSGTYTITILP
jgi:hypothetical protein